ncbi:MAG TPA: PfkB family carbohydrate kinase [Halobacteriales archaeon]|nr:PfkB family carbohydrate kinase [Halobacteriales archaeon]
MGRVVSLGSVNVDRIIDASSADLDALEDRYSWFPARGETVSRERLPDDFPTDADEERLGGKGANQAVAAASAGAAAAMLGKVGPDADEVGAVGALESAGVDVGGIETADAPTGTAFVFVGPDGDNRIVVRPGANDTVDDAYVRGHYESIRRADCLLLQNEVPVDPVVGLLEELAGETDPPTVVLDPAPVDGAERLLATGVVAYCTPNDREYEALRPWLSTFDGTVVRTRGGEEVVVEAPDGDDAGVDERFAVEPPSVDVVDTTGAGDVFDGFLGARIAAGDSLRRAVEVATVAGSLSTTAEGARGEVPTMEEVLAFERSGTES